MAQVPSKFKLLESTQFKALVGKIGRTQATLTADIQVAAVQAVAHSILHGNIMPASQLYGAMGKSMRKDSLLAWLETYGCVVWSTVDKVMKYDTTRKGKMEFDDEVAEVLLATPWNTAVRQPEAVSKFDIDQMFDKFLAKCRKIAKDAETDKSIKVANVELLNVLSSASAQYFDAKAKVETPKPKQSKGEKRAEANRAIKVEVEAQQRADKFNERVVEPTLHLQQQPQS
jgi:hypothetical protein